jgi:hypothetical protein
MFPYPLKSNNPIYRSGMNAILATTSGQYTAVEIFPVADTEDEVLVYGGDDSKGWHGYSIQAEGISFEIDLHDPIVALQILIRFVAVNGHGTKYYAEKRLRDELLFDDKEALDRRANLLLSLLADLDIPAADAAKKEST